MLKNTTLSAIVLSIAIISTQSPAQASINPKTLESNLTKANSNLVKLDIGHGLEQTVAQSPDADHVQVAWSISGAYKKTKRAAKKTGRIAGRGIRKVNRVIVPAEIRNGSSWAYGKAKRGARRVRGSVPVRFGNPFKRCRPSKYIIGPPTCKVGGAPANIHDHRRK